MFEFNDDDLFTNKSLLNRHDGAFYCCYATNSAEDQLAELARLVGGDSSTAEQKPQPITLVDTAPKLEFDLEGELTKAFDTVPYASVDQSANYDMNSIEEAFAPPPQTAPTNMPRVEDQPAALDHSDAELSELISQEFERALEEEAMVETGPTPIPVKSTFQAPDAAMQERAEKNFEAELAKLMGSEVGAVPFDKTPPPPQPAMAPWSEPEIVATPELPATESHETPAVSNGEFAAPQMSDYDQVAVKKPSVIDPIDEYLADGKEVIIPDPVVEAPDPHADIVFEGASNLAAVAQRTNNEADEVKVAGIGNSSSQNAHWNGNDSASVDDISIPEPAVIHEVMGQQRAGRKVAGSLLTVALLAGACLVGWNVYNGNPQNVPTILASSDPVKVKPKDAGGKVVPNQDQAVFKSVESDEKVKPQQKRLADNTEKPIAVATTGSGKAEVRVIESDTSSTGGLPVQPRRVRTVVVKPDGTIINTSGDIAKPAPVKVATITPKSATPKVEAPKKVAPSVKDESTPKSLAKVQEVKETTPRKIEIKAPMQVEPKKVVTKVAEQVAAKTAEIQKPVLKKPVLKKPEVKKPEVNTAAIKKPEVKKPVAVAPKKVEPVKVAKVEPVKKAKVEKAVALPTVKSAYAVQISSQRSPEAAEKSYKSMARKYAAVIGGKGVDIRKAVIDGRGTYYRVRIPASSKSAANNLCRKLKSRGGDCLVTR